MERGVLGVVAYLTVDDGAAALAFYHEAFGAVEVVRLEDGGKVAHAEMRIGRSRVFLSDEFPGIGVLGPKTLGGASSAMVLAVEDADTAAARAIAAGAKELRPVAETFDGAARTGKVEDPFGHQWLIHAEARPFVAGETVKRPGNGGPAAGGTSDG